ncbi:xanthine dehydrogenase accessory protein XdhC [Microbacterium murale]|uniref:Xanthine dehydrogenase accessory protein XdhC n=1 Tax=Microbacterium murale TaxID=1081040 RepID=A0ABU0P7V0_9MICO|nr:xanthine dehydrogenase accessory protein XdhC [Microbacterium murale]MDQ0643415.1 xanthine dehydrogenase accessory protein XdhC [Microbacterium murale]
MDWLDALQDLRTRRVPAVVVTMALVRGHAPRNGGAKMVVSPDDVFGTIGGGNLEATAIDRARAMLASGAAEPELLTLTLSDKATTEYGVQCCGGEVTMMLEPMRVVPVVAIFGVGHVGLELARVLARHEIDLHLIDSRPEMLAPSRLGEPGRDGVFGDAVARVRITHSPVPEAALSALPAGAHVLVMTHDHVEDLAVVDQSLRTDGIRSIGLIGSSSKWARFRKKLTELGQSDADLARVTTPIGVPEVTGKQPAVIAVSVAARILQLIDEAAPVAVQDDQGDEPDAVNEAAS